MNMTERICPESGGCDSCPDRAHCERLRTQPWQELTEMAWGLIANAGGGSWDRESADWKQAAERWRDQYHALLGVKRASGKEEERERWLAVDKRYLEDRAARHDELARRFHTDPSSMHVHQSIAQALRDAARGLS